MVGRPVFIDAEQGARPVPVVWSRWIRMARSGPLVLILERICLVGPDPVSVFGPFLMGPVRNKTQQDLLVAATDTSAATSVWVMTGLMKNPRAMKKAEEEVRNLCGKKEFIEEDDIQKLVYFKAVIKETLRFYAPAPLVPRETNKSFILNGYEIEPKTLVYVNVWAVHRDTETWEDPEEFYPERFLNNDVDFKGLDFELIPFGAGRRICPGIPLGIATVELITANLLNSFDWEMPPGMVREDIDTDGLPGLARHKKNHLCLVAKNPSK